MKISRLFPLYFLELLALIALFLFNLTDQYFPFWFILGGFVAVTVFKKWVNEIVIVLSAGALISQNYFGVAVKYDSAVSVVTSAVSIELRIYSLIVFLGICLLIKQTFKKLNSGYTTFIFLILFPVLSIVSYRLFDRMLLASLFALNIWNFFIYYRFMDSTERQSWVAKLKSLLSSLPPLWTRATETRELLSYDLYKDRSEEDHKKCVQSGCLMILRGLVIIVVLKRIDLWGLNYYSELVGLNPAKFTSLHRIIPIIFSKYNEVPTYHIWVLIYYAGTKFLFESYYGFLSVSIGVARLLGLNLTSSTNKPWEAGSFPDFCGRFMYYYGFILSNYFYLPLQKSLGWTGMSNQVRRRICLFLAITVGGVYFHIVKNFSEHLSRESLLASLGNYSAPAILYFSTFAFFCSFIVFERKNAGGIFIRSAYFLFYLGLYSFLFSSQFLGQLITNKSITPFLLNLFGG